MIFFLGILNDYDKQWKQQRDTSMMILRNLGNGKNRIEEIITGEVEELCKIMTTKEGQIYDIRPLLE